MIEHDLDVIRNGDYVIDMKLFHAGDRIIETPDLFYGRKNADFGQGFYLTPDKEFAYRWAGEGAIVNEYFLDKTDLRVQYFSREIAWYCPVFMRAG